MAGILSRFEKVGAASILITLFVLFPLQKVNGRILAKIGGYADQAINNCRWVLRCSGPI
jgi:hypothetical protein